MNDTTGPLTTQVRDDGVAIVTYDVAGETMNTLRADFVQAFTLAFDELEQREDVRAAVLCSGKPDSFIAGADIHMLDSLGSRDDVVATIRRGHLAMAKLRHGKKPVVAAVHGPALGGGFEVALACHGRVCSDSDKTVFGLPEVQLGLLPGLSGLQMLADKAGLQVAIEHGLTGKSLRPRKARSLGVVDDVVPRPILIEVAAARALRLVAEPANPAHVGFGAEGLTRLALEKNPLGRGVLFRKAREEARKKTGGHYPAADKILDVLESFASDGFEASQEVEAQAFAELLESSVSKNLRSIFFATTALKKDTGADRPATPREVGKIGMLGAGLMGAGILDEQVKRRRLTREERAATLARLSTSTDYSGMKNVELVIEAVFEDLALKHRVLQEVEAACKTGVIFASNTSSIPITRIAEVSKAPENVVGMHYFSPVHKMPLLEVIRTAKTSDEAVVTAVAVGKRQGKTVIVVNDGVGFYTSRVLGPYMNEASYILTEGVAVDAIDRAMTAFGWPVGPLTLVDEVGIDVAAHVGPIMLEAFGERMAPPPTITRLVEDGRKGRKNQKGFYLYGDAAKKRKKVDESVYAALDLEVPAGRAPVSTEEIQERCNLQLVNEAMHCLGEGILRSARDGDIGAIFGLGFPPFLGGPFRYVDALGATRVLDRIRHYRDRFGRRFEPAPILVDMAKAGRTFHG